MEPKKSNDIISMMEEWFKKLPALPPKGVDVLVQIAPWIALVFGVLGVLGSLAAFGILGAYAPFVMYSYGAGFGLGYVSLGLSVVSSVLLLAAFPGLKNKKMAGWNMLFWSEVVSGLASIVVFSVGGIIGTLIAFYLIFQIKAKYK